MGASATRLTSHLRQWSTGYGCRRGWKGFWKRIKLSSHVSDLPGLSGRLMMQAPAEGETNQARIAALATQGLKATQEELQDAWSAAVAMNPLQRRVLGLFLERLALLETQVGCWKPRLDTLEKSTAEALRQHQASVQRLAAVPGLGADLAQQTIADHGHRPKPLILDKLTSTAIDRVRGRTQPRFLPPIRWP